MVKAFKLDQAAAVSEGEPRSDKGDDEVFSSDECESDNEELEDKVEECEIDDVDQDVADFEHEEISHASVFKQQGLKRLSCFSDTLQLISSFNKDASAKRFFPQHIKWLNRFLNQRKQQRHLYV